MEFNLLMMLKKKIKDFSNSLGEDDIRFNKAMLNVLLAGLFYFLVESYLIEISKALLYLVSLLFFTLVHYFLFYRKSSVSLEEESSIPKG